MIVSLEEAYHLAENYVHEQMENLSTALVYHRPWHTFDDVMPAAEKLAEREGVQPPDLILLKTAVLFHDLGYLERYSDNEVIGARIAGDTLIQFGYDKEDILRIKSIITATTTHVKSGKMVQSAGSDLLEKIICDADLDNFGRPDFLWLGSLIRKEMENYGMKMSDSVWYERQRHLLLHHQYFTASAHLLRDEGKQENLRKVEELLGDM